MSQELLSGDIHTQVAMPNVNMALKPPPPPFFNIKCDNKYSLLKGPPGHKGSILGFFIVICFLVLARILL